MTRIASLLLLAFAPLSAQGGKPPAAAAELGKLLSGDAAALEGLPARPALRGEHAPSLLALAGDPLPAALAIGRALPVDPARLSPVTVLELAAEWQGLRLPRARRVDLREVKDLDDRCYAVFRAIQKVLPPLGRAPRANPELHAEFDAVVAAAAAAKFDAETHGRHAELGKTLDLAVLLHAARELSALVPQIAARQQTWLRGPREQAGEGIVGKVLLDQETAYGRIVVGDEGPNIYDCNLISVVIDLGGDDQYRGAVADASRRNRLSVCIDMGGKDRYTSESGAMGSASHGLGLLIDVAGDDVYKGRERSAGFGAFGLGVCIDLAGDDTYEVGPWSLGTGVQGLGIHFDADGADERRAGSMSMGVGLAAGLGLMLDARGDDKNKMYNPQGPAVCGLGVGLALGLAPGIGLYFDLAGDDNHQAGERSLGMGSGAGLGICYDRVGRDSYIGAGMSLAAAESGGSGLLFDISGKDHYFAAEGVALAASGGLALLSDRGGEDIYEVAGPGLCRAGFGAMAVLEDLGGKDSFRRREAPARRFAPEQLPPRGPRAGRRPAPATRRRAEVWRIRGLEGDRFKPAALDPQRLDAAARAGLRKPGREDVRILILDR